LMAGNPETPPAPHVAPPGMSLISDALSLVERPRENVSLAVMVAVSAGMKALSIGVAAAAGGARFGVGEDVDVRVRRVVDLPGLIVIGGRTDGDCA